MTDIQYILEVIRPQYLIFKSDGVMRLSPEDNVKVRGIYQTQFGRPMGTCNTCFAEQLLSLIVKFEEIEKQTDIFCSKVIHFNSNDIEKATIATDKQPKRKKKIDDPFKGIKIDI